ncbi:hypothetical protein J4Q44_G00024840 [Coregonus suidteri]|uniref:TLC domain-containing protein n=1 Tax=Coregonus suidteri TaxID=861788 RepID=A0AAN8R8E2_9TELE
MPLSFSQKPWLYDFKEMWAGLPYSDSPAVSVLRKDFKEQMVHHMATIFLISFLLVVNYIRAGTLIMLLHDSSDYLLESAKMFIYAGWRNTSNYVFFLFATVFIFTRLYIFPFYIIYATYVYPLTMYSPFFGYYFLNFLMMVLQCLHIFWAILILRMAVRFLSSDEKVEDERSDKEETDESGEEEEEVKRKGAVQNGDAAHNNHQDRRSNENVCEEGEPTVRLSFGAETRMNRLQHRAVDYGCPPAARWPGNQNKLTILALAVSHMKSSDEGADRTPTPPPPPALFVSSGAQFYEHICIPEEQEQEVGLAKPRMGSPQYVVSGDGPSDGASRPTLQARCLAQMSRPERATPLQQQAPYREGAAVAWPGAFGRGLDPLPINQVTRPRFVLSSVRWLGGRGQQLPLQGRGGSFGPSEAGT